MGPELYMVVDSSMLFLAQPEEGVSGGEETVVVCLAPMRNITASAVDGLWLHIAIKYVPGARERRSEARGTQLEASATHRRGWRGRERDEGSARLRRRRVTEWAVGGRPPRAHGRTCSLVLNPLRAGTSGTPAP